MALVAPDPSDDLVAYFTGQKGKEIAAALRWSNPDGSKGGWVAENATVHDSVQMAPTSIVCPHAIVEQQAILGSEVRVCPRATVSAGQRIDDDHLAIAEPDGSGGLRTVIKHWNDKLRPSRPFEQWTLVEGPAPRAAFGSRPSAAGDSLSL